MKKQTPDKIKKIYLKYANDIKDYDISIDIWDKIIDYLGGLNKHDFIIHSQYLEYFNKKDIYKMGLNYARNIVDNLFKVENSKRNIMLVNNDITQNQLYLQFLKKHGKDGKAATIKLDNGYIFLYKNNYIGCLFLFKEI